MTVNQVPLPCIHVLKVEQILDVNPSSKSSGPSSFPTSALPDTWATRKCMECGIQDAMPTTWGT